MSAVSALRDKCVMCKTRTPMAGRRICEVCKCAAFSESEFIPQGYVSD